MVYKSQLKNKILSLISDNGSQSSSFSRHIVTTTDNTKCLPPVRSTKDHL